MRRTVLFFHLPTPELVYIELGDSLNKPVAGENYTLEGVRYKVTDVLESIGEMAADDTGRLHKRSGMDKLLEMLAIRFDQEAIALLARMRNVGSGDQPDTYAGTSILLPGKSMIGDFDHAVLVTVMADTVRKPSSAVLQQLKLIATGNVLDLTAGSHEGAA
jgi:hypothetical protein